MYAVTVDLEAELRFLLNQRTPPVALSSIVVIESHPFCPGQLLFQPGDGNINSFYSRYQGWVSCHLVLNELFNLPSFVDRLCEDGFEPVFAANTEPVLAAMMYKWMLPLEIEGYELRSFQQYGLRRAFERGFWFFNWATGSGKSYCCAAGAKYLFDHDEIDVVIAATISKSKIDLCRFFTDDAHLDAVVNDGTKPKRTRVYGERHQVYVMNYEKLWVDGQAITELVTNRRVLWIFDEALALDTPILTREEGWKTIESAQPGDWVPGTKGWVEVLGKTKVWDDRPCYRVLTQDGGEVVCSENHQWTVCSGRDGTDLITLTTKELELMVRLFDVGWSRRPVRIAIPRGVEYPQRDFDLDPYVLGYWLGDGVTGCATLSVGDEDREEVQAEMSRRGIITTFTGGTVLYLSRPGATTRNGRSVRSSLARLGVLNSKHIPQIYLESSHEQRLELLRGLMDADGYCSPRGDVAVYTQRPGVLMDAVEQLIRSLGYSPQRRVLTRSGFITSIPAHQLTWFPLIQDTPFCFLRKASRVRGTERVASKKVTAILPVDSVPVQCLQVDAPDHLFVVGPTWMLTHNCHKIISDTTNGAKYNNARRMFDQLYSLGAQGSKVWPMSASVVNGNPLRFRDVYNLEDAPNPLGTKATFVARYADKVDTFDLKTPTKKTFTLTTYSWNTTRLQEIRHRVADRTMAVRKTDPGIRELFKGLDTILVNVQRSKEEVELAELLIDEAWEAYQRGESMGPYYHLLRAGTNIPAALLASDSIVMTGIFARHPDLCATLPQIASAKVDKLNEQLESIREGGDQVLVFTHYTTLGLHLIKDLIEVPHVVHWGAGQSDTESQRVKDEFKTTPDITCFLTSDAGSHGLNMQNARYVIQLEPTYSFDEGMQRASRIDRADSHLDGLTNFVYLAEDSVDERVWAVNNARRAISSAVQGTEESYSHGDAERERALRSEAENTAWLLFGSRMQ